MSKITKTDLLIDIYCPKSGIIFQFQVVPAANGWQFYSSEKPIFSGRDGAEFLGYLRRHEGVSYPNSTQAFFEGLWDDIAHEGLHYKVIQERLEEIGNWISKCSRQVPRW